MTAVLEGLPLDDVAVDYTILDIRLDSRKSRKADHLVSGNCLLGANQNL